MYFCNMIFRHLLNMRSHPTWVCGLKQTLLDAQNSSSSSHPTWVRGLKQLIILHLKKLLNVAPYVGAWIETRFNEVCCGRCEVSPYVGAWIET